MNSIYIFKIIFFSTLFLVGGTYVLYPFFIYLTSIISPKKRKKKEEYPFVSIIISAFNEEKHIMAKIKNTLNIEYPDDKFEILIGSDGSTDNTVELVKNINLPKIKLFDFKVNRGKTAVQNDLVDHARGEILVFMDAASFVNSGAVKELVKNFADPDVGCVGGTLYFSNTDENITTASQGIYWNYELFLRKKEAVLGRMIGVDGPLYAMRKELYEKMDQDIISDFISPLLVLQKKRMVVLEPSAIVFEEPTKKTKQEIKTRRRITVRALHSLFRYKSLLSPIKNPILFLQIFFHKVIRWFVGPLLLLNVISAYFLANQFWYKIYLFLFVTLLLLALIGYQLDKMEIKNKIFAVPYYFFLVNFAAFLGIMDFLRKKNVVSWKPVR